MDISNKDEEDAIDKTAENTFFSKVTFSGFENYVIEQNRYLRIFWLIVITAASIWMVHDVWCLLSIALQTNKRTSHDRLLLESQALRMSNVTICAPTAINKTRFRELFTIPDEIWSKIQKSNRTSHYSKDDVVEQAAIMLTTSIGLKNVDPPLKRYIREMFNSEVNNRSSANAMTLMLELMPKCEDMIGDCRFNGTPFDCCSVAVFAQWDGYGCYKLALDVGDSATFMQKRPGSDYGLIMNAFMDTRYVPFVFDDMTDGFLIFVDGTPSPFSSPVVVWPGAHAYVRTKARKLRMTTSCLVQPAPLRFMDSYDPMGIHCKSEMMLDLLQPILGCRPPWMTYVPRNNESCTYVAAEALNAMFTTEALDSASKSQTDRIGGRFRNKDPRSFFTSVFNDPQCSPLCSQWSYEPMISYSQIAPMNPGSVPNYLRLSRISVFHGNLEYEKVDEQAITSSYIQFSAVGGLAGVYIGASVVSFVQFAFYGLWWCMAVMAKRRQKRVVIEKRKVPRRVGHRHRL